MFQKIRENCIRKRKEKSWGFKVKCIRCGAIYFGYVEALPKINVENTRSLYSVLNCTECKGWIPVYAQNLRPRIWWRFSK